MLKVIYKNQKKLLYCQARLASCHSPWRVVTGHVLCKLAVAKGSSPWRNYRSWTNSARLGELLLARARFISMKDPARHEGSPWARQSEFTQNLLCFCEISKINLSNTYNPHPKACNHTIHIIYDRMERNLGVNSSHTTIFLNPKLTCKVHNFGESN